MQKMRSVTIEGKKREELGSKSAKHLRREGFVPCVIYGAGENVHFFTEETSFKDILYTAEALLILINVNGKEHKTVVRDWQFHPVTDELEHVDFFEFTAGKEITVNVPVQLVGNAKGVRNGGRLKVNLRRLPIKATMENMPGFLELNIEKLKIGDAMRIEDIPLEGFEIMREPNRAILTIQTARNIVVDEVEDEEDEEGVEGEEGTEASAEGEGATEGTEEKAEA